MSVDDASKLLDDPSWTLVSGPSKPFNLFEACKTGDVGIVRELIKGDSGLANAKEDWGIRPLHVAATEGHAEVVALLLDNGADVDAKNDYGVTPLYLAAAWGHVEVVSPLLAAGADKTIEEQNGETPLEAATRKGHKAAAELLEGK
jgi:ankyrin repeat protein